MNSGLQKLHEVFKSSPTSPAVEDMNEIWSYEDLYKRSFSLASMWKETVDFGRRILIIPEKRIDFIASVLACSIGGFHPILVSEKAKSDELEYIKKKTEPALEWRGNGPVFNENTGLEIIFQNVPILFFTSGTTGQPKGVCHELESVLSNAISFNKSTGLDKSTRMLHVMPIGYMAGLLNTFISPLVTGGTAIVGDIFSPSSVMGLWHFCMNKRINSMWLSPTMVATMTKLCRDKEISNWASSNLKNVFVGTAPLHEATRTAFREKLGVDCRQSYGMTECMLISVCGQNEVLENSVGTPIDGVQFEVRGEGESIWIKSKFLSKGYLLEDESELTALETESGWLDSGDIGKISDDGNLFITGRHKDLIIKGGLNISPKSIENILLSFPGVVEVAVVGVPHEFWGEEVLACIQLESGKNIDTSKLKLYCREKLPKDAVPSRFIVIDEFPRNSSGKILKRALRDL